MLVPPPAGVSDSVHVGRGLRVCVSNKLHAMLTLLLWTPPAENQCSKATARRSDFNLRAMGGKPLETESRLVAARGWGSDC